MHHHAIGPGFRLDEPFLSVTFPNLNAT